MTMMFWCWKLLWQWSVWRFVRGSRSVIQSILLNSFQQCNVCMRWLWSLDLHEGCTFSTCEHQHYLCQIH